MSLHVPYSYLCWKAEKNNIPQRNLVETLPMWDMNGCRNPWRVSRRNREWPWHTPMGAGVEEEGVGCSHLCCSDRNLVRVKHDGCSSVSKEPDLYRAWGPGQECGDRPLWSYSHFPLHSPEPSHTRISNAGLRGLDHVSV